MVVALGLAIEFGIDAGAIALLALLITAAVIPLAQLTAAILGRLPGPLAVLGQLAVSAVEGAVGDVVGFAAESVNGLAHAIDYPFRAIWTVLASAEAATAALSKTVWKLRTVVIPGVASALSDYATALFTDAVRYTQQVVGQAEARADAEFAVAQAYAQAAVMQAEARADAEFEAAQAYAQAIGAEALSYTQQAVSQLAADVANAEGRIVGYAQALTGEAISDARAGLADLTDFVERVEAADQQYARDVGDAVAGAAAGAMAAAAAAAAAATSAVATRVQEIEDSPCQQHCSPLGDIGSLVQDLEDAGLLAILMGVVAEALHDPKALAAELQDATVVPARAALGALSSLGIG